ncbi:class I SAM-dependent methyltransferase [Pseudomonadota bacterium]
MSKSSFPNNLYQRAKRPLQRKAAFNLLKKYHGQSRSIEDRVNWAMNFGSKGPYKIRTLQVPYEINALAEAVDKLKPRIILEIGTARAGTLLLWSSLASEKVISCDIADMTVQDELYRSLPPPDSDCEVVLLSGDSHTEEFKQRVVRELAGEQVDFLFIDGDHRLEGVTTDYNNYRELVRPGGIIAFHDILEKQPLPENQVYHLWKVLSKELDTEEFVQDYDQRGYGIGVVHVPS